MNKEKKRKYNRQYYKNNREKLLKYHSEYRKEHLKEYRREYHKKRYEKIKQYVSDYKLSKGCSICGYNKCPEALDFHHNGDKGFSIGTNLLSKGFEKIKVEMEKCIVLCSNCHREKHAEEKIQSTTY